MLRIKASMKQLQKLRNGHPTRVSPAVEGEGFNLIIHPDRYNHILKTFSKGKGSVISLSPEELQANRQVQGSGIFSSLKKAGKAVMKSPITKAVMKSPVAKALAKKAVDYGVKTASESGYVPPELAGMLGAEVNKAIGSGVLSSLKKAVKSIAKSPITKAIIKSPVAKSLAKQAVDYGVKTAKSSGYVPAGLADMAGDYAKGQIGSGIYAGASGGQGLYAGASRGGGVSGRGSLLNVNNSHLPPAMQSQNASSNFNFHTQLPPALASIKGSGIYM